MPKHHNGNYDAAPPQEMQHPQNGKTAHNWSKSRTNIKKTIVTAVLANQSNIALELPEIWILLPLLISPINP